MLLRQRYCRFNVVIEAPVSARTVADDRRKQCPVYRHGFCRSRNFAMVIGMRPIVFLPIGCPEKRFPLRLKFWNNLLDFTAIASKYDFTTEYGQTFCSLSLGTKKWKLFLPCGSVFDSRTNISMLSSVITTSLKVKAVNSATRRLPKYPIVVKAFFTKVSGSFGASYRNLNISSLDRTLDCSFALESFSHFLMKIFKIGMLFKDFHPLYVV